MQETGPTVYNPYLGSDPLARLFFMFLRRRKMYLILKQDMSRSFEGFGGERALGFLRKIELSRKRSKFRM